MNENLDCKVFDILTGNEICTFWCRSRQGKEEEISIRVDVLQRMNYLQAIGAILDVLDGITGGLSEMEKHFIVRNIRDYLMAITK